MDKIPTTWDMDNPDYSAIPYPIIYRASSIGYCPIAQAAKRLGMRQLPWPDEFLAKFQRGHEIEEEVIADLRSGGFQVWNQQKQVVLPITSTIAIVGHLDGEFCHTTPYLDRALIIDSEQRLLEVKSMSSDMYDSFKGWDTPGVFQKYKWQVSALMLATNLPATVIVREAVDTDRVNLTVKAPRQRSLEVDTPFYSVSQIRERILGIERLIINGLEECRELEWPCAVAYLHPERESPSDERVAGLVADLRQARAGVSEAKKELEERTRQEREVRDRLVEAMGENKTMEGATKYQQANPVQYDWDRMREDGIKLEKYRKETVKSWRVRLAKESKDEV